MNIYEDLIEGIKGVLIYKIGDAEYCTDIQYIAAVKRIDEIKQNAGQNYISQIEYNQSAFSIIDLHNIYKTNPLKQTNNIRIIMQEMFGKNFCFFADRVLEILSTDKIFMEKTMDLLPYSGKNFIKYILKYQNRDILFPDFEKITKSLYKLNEFHHMA